MSVNRIKVNGSGSRGDGKSNIPVPHSSIGSLVH
jgi:hypothetical protein